MAYQEFHEVRVSSQCIYNNDPLQGNYNVIAYFHHLHFKMV